MKWFDNWFAKKCKQAWENANTTTDAEEDRPVSKLGRLYPPTAGSIGATTKSSRAGNAVDEEIIHLNQCYTLKMQNATGGTVLQVSHFDQSKDEWVYDLYVVDDNKDLGQEITSILVQYRLKHI